MYEKFKWYGTSYMEALQYRLNWRGFLCMSMADIMICWNHGIEPYYWGA